MRVICIDDKPKFDKPEADWVIKFGEVYDVIGEFNVRTYDYYELNIQPGVGYAVEHFIPLSEINETELSYNYKTQPV